MTARAPGKGCTGCCESMGLSALFVSCYVLLFGLHIHDLDLLGFGEKVLLEVFRRPVTRWTVRELSGSRLLEEMKVSAFGVRAARSWDRLGLLLHVHREVRKLVDSIEAVHVPPFPVFAWVKKLPIRTFPRPEPPTLYCHTLPPPQNALPHLRHSPSVISSPVRLCSGSGPSHLSQRTLSGTASTAMASTAGSSGWVVNTTSVGNIFVALLKPLQVSDDCDSQREER